MSEIIYWGVVLLTVVCFLVEYGRSDDES